MSAQAPGPYTPSLPLSRDLIVNERQREIFRFRREDCTPESLKFDFRVGPGGGMEGLHKHATQDEHFRCVSGELTVLLVDGEMVLRAGDEHTIKAGTSHAFVNRGDVEVVCDVSYDPPGRNEDFLKVLNAVEIVNGRQPSFLEVAPFIGDSGMFIEGPPIWLQRILFGALSIFATVFGYRRRAIAAMEEVYGEPFTW